jgi:hypothetical protein
VLLAVTDARDDTANAVLAGLSHFGAPWARVNLAEFPERTELAFDPCHPDRGRIRDAFAGLIDLDRVTAVWNWHPKPFTLLPGLDGVQAGFVASACRAAWSALLAPLEARCRTVNPTDAEIRAGDKARQLRAAAARGFRVPETLITNSPARALDFCSRFPQTVFKLLNPGRLAYPDRDLWFGTRLLDRGDLAELETLRHCPGLFQRRIPKRFDLRVTVVGDQLFPVAIHSQADERSAVDYRPLLAAHPAALAHRVHPLPPAVAAAALALARDLGLHYCAMDLALTPEGEYVFFEVNPSGQYGWIEATTGLPITRALTRLLMAA